MIGSNIQATVGMANSFRSLGENISSATVASMAFKNAWAAIPTTGKITLILTAIGALVTAIISISNAIKNAQKSADDWQKEVDAAQSKIDELNGKLEENQTRLTEIKKLHDTDQWTDELDKEETALEGVNEQLRLRMQYEERLLEASKRGLYEATKKELYETGRHYKIGNDQYYSSDTVAIEGAIGALESLAGKKSGLDATSETFLNDLDAYVKKADNILVGISEARSRIQDAISNGTVDKSTADALQDMLDRLLQAVDTFENAAPDLRGSYFQSLTSTTASGKENVYLNQKEELERKLERRTRFVTYQDDHSPDDDPIVQDLRARIEAIHKLLALESELPAYQTQLDSLFGAYDKFEDGKLSVAEFNDQIKVLLQLIAELQAADPEKFNDTWVSGLLAIFGIESGQSDYLDTVIDKLRGKMYEIPTGEGDLRDLFGGMSYDELTQFTKWLSEADGKFATGAEAISAWRKAMDEAGGAAAKAFKAFKSMDDMDNFKDQVETLSKAYNDMTSDGRVGFDALKGIQDAFTDEDGNAMVEGLQDYIDRLAELRNDADGTKAVLNELLTSYVQNQLAVEDLADANPQLVAALLKEAGVANADAVAFSMVTSAIVRTRIAADDADGAFDAIIASLSETEQAAVNTAIAVANDALAFSIANNTQLDLSGSIASLSSLTSTSQGAAIAVSALMKTLDQLSRLDKYAADAARAAQRAEQEIINQTANSAWAKMTQHASQQMQSMLESFDFSAAFSKNFAEALAEWESNFTTTTSGSGGSSKTTAEKLVDEYNDAKSAIEAYIELQKHLYDDAVRNGEWEKAAQIQVNIANAYKQIQFNAHKAADALRDYYASLGMTTEEIEAQADILNLRNDYAEASEEILENQITLLDDMKQVLEDVNGELDEFKNIYKTLVDAADQYHTDGFLHVDTLKEILDFGPELTLIAQHKAICVAINTY